MGRITEEGFTLLGRQPGGHGGFSGYLLARVLPSDPGSDRCCREDLQLPYNSFARGLTLQRTLQLAVAVCLGGKLKFRCTAR